MTGVRHTDNRLVREGDHRVNITLPGELDSQVRQIAARKRMKLATLLREWIAEKVMQETEKSC